MRVNVIVRAGLLTVALNAMIPTEGTAQLCAGCYEQVFPEIGPQHLFPTYGTDSKDCEDDPGWGEEEIAPGFWCHYTEWRDSYCSIHDMCFDNEEEDLALLTSLREAVARGDIEEMQQLVEDRGRTRRVRVIRDALVVHACDGAEVGRVVVPKEVLGPSR